MHSPMPATANTRHISRRQQPRLRPLTLALFALLLASGVLSACNLPGQPTASPAGAIYTAAARTLEAQLTQISQPPATSAGLPNGITPQPTFTATQAAPGAPTNTPAPSASPSQVSACDQARFVGDVSIPDNSEFLPGARFTKTWRIQNTGTCTWTTDYHLTLAGKDQLTSPERVALPRLVAPNETVDVSLELIAPAESGTYRSEYLLANQRNEQFGIGGPDKTVWVQIKVGVQRGLVYDFLASASRADWIGGAPTGEEVVLTFNAASDDGNGLAAIKDKVELENGSTSGKVLLTYPFHKNNGFISGKYPAYTIQTGDHFKARLGFLLTDGSCSGGQVIYRLKIQEDGKLRTLQEWPKECNRRLLPVDLDLSAYKGKSVRFILEVEADGGFEGDWAIWNSARIEN